MMKGKGCYFKSLLSLLEIMKKDEDNKPVRLRLRTTMQQFRRTKSFSIGAPRYYVVGGTRPTKCVQRNGIGAKVQSEALRPCNGCLLRESRTYVH